MTWVEMFAFEHKIHPDGPIPARSWRERTADARERGYFTVEDQIAWLSLSRCPAGVAAKCYGIPFTPETFALWHLGEGFHRLMRAGDFNGCERLLDRIDDLALKLKREMAT